MTFIITERNKRPNRNKLSRYHKLWNETKSGVVTVTFRFQVAETDWSFEWFIYPISVKQFNSSTVQQQLNEAFLEKVIHVKDVAETWSYQTEPSLKY